MLVVHTQNLTKSFGKTKALDGLNFDVKKGEVHGFLGPNGAGKSTTIRILIGALRKSGGEVRLFDGDPWHDIEELHSRLAYVPGDVRLWGNLTGGEVIDLLGKLRGGINPVRRKELIERFNLDPTKKCRTYSKGNLQKVALISAFSSDVELYILDEPTSGLDPLMEAVFQQCIKEVKQAGKTVLLSSHILAEIEALCDRVSIIREGKIVESGTLSQLRHLTRTSVTVTTAKTITGLEKLAGIYNVKTEGNTVKLQVDGSEMANLIKHISTFEVISLISTPPTLEELFMRHYGDHISMTQAAKSGKRGV